MGSREGKEDCSCLPSPLVAHPSLVNFLLSLLLSLLFDLDLSSLGRPNRREALRQAWC